MAPASSRLALHLARHAETAWSAVIRPWLQAGAGRLEVAHVIVPTRGQAHALKQRCLREGVALLGVEFLTPGLARHKWHDPAQVAVGRELLLLGLRSLIARRLAPLPATDPAWGFWQSLQSDPERALDDFDDLLKAGFRAADFPLEPLRGLFTDLTAWVEAHGYALAALVAESAGLESVPPERRRVGGRVLVCGLGPEAWGEFFNVAAFVRRCDEVTVVLPEPAFGGKADLDERWVSLWSVLLGVEAQPIDAPEPAEHCEAVGALWSHGAEAPAGVRLLVGRTRGDEMRLVAREIEARLAAGAENVGVVFPRADSAHLLLARLLQARGVAYVDLLEAAGPPALEVQTQRALLAFHAGGARVEGLLALWPLLRAAGIVTASGAEARRAAERSFDRGQVHAVAAYADEWAEPAPELARVARALLPAWPAELTLGDALRRFRAMCAALELEPPEGLGPLDTLAAREPALFPGPVVLATLDAFLPSSAPVSGVPGRGTFARVTLGTWRRMEGVAWSHLLLAESNAGSWPARREPSCWLTDDQRAKLNERSRFSLGLFTSDDRLGLERAGYQRLVRDTRHEVVFSAALFAESEPEVRLGPNNWMERVLWAQAGAGAETKLEEEFERRAVEVPAAEAPPGHLAGWEDVWQGRRDPARPFDEFFFCGDPARITPAKLPAKLVERGVRDPAELWFEAVLGTQRVGWEPLARARRKALGQQAHQVLAAALRGSEVAKGFSQLPTPAEAGERLAGELASRRACWPRDRYWDSFAAELAHLCTALLDNVFALDRAGEFVATEAWLPPGAEVARGAWRLPVAGRMDLVRLDRPAWAGADVDIIDFKTGGDLELSAERMARSGASLQLGVYLAGLRAAGVRAGRVWMIKPEPGARAMIGLDELDAALAKLDWLATAMTRGTYGALTPDRSDYAPPGYAWPLACTPVKHAVLASKFALTFGSTETEAPDE
ncbi:MAG: PD-(D/E)XK nuclease family protein [Verrucomicrobia bacterium]|nr:PD-(D/E)XK nuclease family protein [Verrucomicrobiota bacterium]